MIKEGKRGYSACLMVSKEWIGFFITLENLQGSRNDQATHP